jgi:hypothetical protein
LLGTAATEALSPGHWPFLHARAAAAEAAARSRLDADAFGAASAAGHALDLEAALAEALALAEEIAGLPELRPQRPPSFPL